MKKATIVASDVQKRLWRLPVSKAFRNGALSVKKKVADPGGRPKAGEPNLPMTLFAKEAAFSVASPKSPILTEPVGPVMKMLSHLRSLWMMGGVLVWRK